MLGVQKKVGLQKREILVPEMQDTKKNNLRIILP